MRHIFRFEIMLRCLGVITIVFGISVVARGDGPAAGKHEKDAVSGTERSVRHRGPWTIGQEQHFGDH